MRRVDMVISGRPSPRAQTSWGWDEKGLDPGTALPRTTRSRVCQPCVGGLGGARPEPRSRARHAVAGAVGGAVGGTMWGARGRACVLPRGCGSRCQAVLTHFLSQWLSALADVDTGPVPSRVHTSDVVLQGSFPRRAPKMPRRACQGWAHHGQGRDPRSTHLCERPVLPGEPRAEPLVAPPPGTRRTLPRSQL